MSDRTTETAVTGYSPTAPEDDLAPGVVVENFKIQCTLGRGGMSTVYGAVHEVIGKRGALKVLKRELCTDQKEVGRFVQEARAVNQIGHANIVDVFAFGTLPDGRSYLIMEWLVGQSLRARMRRGPMSRSEVRDIVLDIVRALEATHAKQIIHRDLKPDNVFLVETAGEKTRAKLLDFGVAKLTGEGRHDRTRAGSMLGTPQYLAPEQARGEPDHRSDIYALGVMVFEMAAGRPPFVGENAFDVVSQHLTEPPPKLSSLAKGVPPELDALVDAMLAKEPADRPSLLRIRGEIEALGGTNKLTLASTGVRATASVRPRSKLPFVIAGLIGALAMVIVFFVARSAKSEEREERREARREDQQLEKLGRPPESKQEPKQEPKPEPKQEPRPAPKQEPKEEPPAPITEKGILVIEWKGSRDVRFVVNGKAVRPNTNIELMPGTYTVAAILNRRIEKHDAVIVAGDLTKVSIKATTRAPSRGNDDLNPLNNAPR